MIQDKVEEIHENNEDLDGILVFLPGYEEISVVSNSRLKTMARIHIITVHASMPVELQVLVFTVHSHAHRQEGGAGHQRGRDHPYNSRDQVCGSLGLL